MIELKRLKLINWHNFENTTFDCARLTYMIGVNDPAASSSLKFSSAVPCACVFRRRKSPFCGPPSLYYIQFTAKKLL